ncbi:MAG: hypothetical protein COT71_01065 [Candidatus Andersenbacteria bacterium CG10_big_fil_rev_8_21_14_0_10_54_11]|uniref:ParB-like N-terminal domain-containing protein n=1 Tax=Candidatus Andersenbacteria bacterium CG10_big_fil_rev_8_21_14_0_10_54_11 TaxID=1974485 RepID=A0A2M6WZZ3_9BACT|nr:MAG: hypothetical protein COT71_01065 [Candidatus Andersenbacteria bacterium CG10_big_fil_rev_8_21_14_0_10_54_11]
MKNAWRGLSALIPNRSVEDPDDILDELDDDEMLEADPLETAEPAERVESSNVSPQPADRGRRRQVNVVGESDADEGEPMAPPAKPNVTPLTIDFDLDQPQPGVAVEAAPPVHSAGPASVRRTISAREVQAVPSARPSIQAVEENDAPAANRRSAAVRDVSAKPVPPIRPAKRMPVAGPGWDQHEEDVRHITIDGITVNPNQPRRQFHAVEMEELTQSIAQHGILQPLVVRRMEDGSYELVAGERRLRAAKELGWEKVPCVVRKDVSSGSSQLELALIENIQRRDLNPVEEAMAYRQLNEEYGMTHEEIGERVGKSRVGITNSMRVLQLPDEIQQGLVDSKITLGHAKAILMIPDEEKQVRFYRHLVEEGLTVRKAETRARRIQRAMHLDDPTRIKRKGRSAFELKYSGLLEDRYGYDSKVRFNDQKNRFEVVFKAFSKEEADELLGRLLGAAPLPEAVAADEGDDEMEEE